MLKKILGSANDRYVRKLARKVKAVGALEDHFLSLSDEELQAKTEEFRTRLDKGESLDQVLVEAFATVREVSKRVMGLRHFDVQLIGGMVLHKGMIGEMGTGEGKTLMSTLPAYLNALEGKGVHVVTVNDYLAQRDAEWMGQIYNFLGLSVSCVIADLDPDDRAKAYQADVTYGTNNEFGFDYLRDNMKVSLEDRVQRPFNYAIIDEVDSILIDEARTPLIISGPAEDSSELYLRIDAILKGIQPEHYELDEKSRSVILTEEGVLALEERLREEGSLSEGGLYDSMNVTLLHHVNQALRAHILYQKDRHYMIKEGGVVLIDEFTGRASQGRRFGEGLHQALEAKEHVEIQRESQTLASVTYQNYFRLYPKLSGMTGTAMTEAGEFEEIYGLQSVAIPPNVPSLRDDQEDQVFRTEEEKNKAMVIRIKEAQEKGQPVLLGTTSIEKSEELSEMLGRENIEHQVLNARYHEQEAYIIAQAGVPGSVTIATNMAGRGTDIQLGGNLDMRLEQALAGKEVAPEQKQAIEERLIAETQDAKDQVTKAGGLYVIGTERHESRRIDNQLRGRSGRQGDPGSTIFYLSLEDDLLRIFGTGAMDAMWRRANLEDGEALTHKWISRAILKAQQKLEARNFEIRKNLLKYDDVMNEQRRVVYGDRQTILEKEELSDFVKEMRENTLNALIDTSIPARAHVKDWAVGALEAEVKRIFDVDVELQSLVQSKGMNEDKLFTHIMEKIDHTMALRAVDYGSETMRRIEKGLTLQVIDERWKEHLHHLDQLRQVIGLRAYGQKDPLQEYKKEAFDLFSAMQLELDEQVSYEIAHYDLHEVMRQIEEAQAQQRAQLAALDAEHRKASHEQQPQQMGQPQERVSRNAPCPCGSGKKYKHCHGRSA